MGLNTPSDTPDRDPKISFEPLSAATLDEALALVKNVFPWDIQDAEQHYRYSLEPDKYKQEIAALNIESLRYWVLIRSNKIVGVTGLYREISDPVGRVSVGWYGVDPPAHGQGMGRALLEWTVQKAREEGYQKLHIWSTDYFAEAPAQEVYEKMGFLVTQTEVKPEEGYTVIHREKDLSEPHGP
jgi:GNAT superfamily N-acetyltransferase